MLLLPAKGPWLAVESIITGCGPEGRAVAVSRSPIHTAASLFIKYRIQRGQRGDTLFICPRRTADDHRGKNGVLGSNNELFSLRSAMEQMTGVQTLQTGKSKQSALNKSLSSFVFTCGFPEINYLRIAIFKMFADLVWLVPAYQGSLARQHF